jgi:hypothetical protein
VLSYPELRSHTCRHDGRGEARTDAARLVVLRHLCCAVWSVPSLVGGAATQRRQVAERRATAMEKSRIVR